RREQARQPAGQRDHDDLGDQVGGLHPGDLVLRRRQPAADLLQRGGDDLDVEQRHKAAKAHHDKRQEALEPSRGSGHRRHFPSRAAARVSTRTVIDRPGLSAPRRASASSSAMRTATRCTILVKLPVAFSGGMTLNTAPLPGARLCTWPWKVLPGSTSATTVAGWPGCICASWSSLQLASILLPRAWM